MKGISKIEASPAPSNGTGGAYVPRGTSILKGIGWEFFKRRNELKMKINALAEASGVSTVTISKIEKGEAGNVSIEILDRIAFALGLEITLSSSYEET